MASTCVKLQEDCDFGGTGLESLPGHGQCLVPFPNTCSWPLKLTGNCQCLWNGGAGGGPPGCEVRLAVQCPSLRDPPFSRPSMALFRTCMVSRTLAVVPSVRPSIGLKEEVMYESHIAAVISSGKLSGLKQHKLTIF